MFIIMAPIVGTRMYAEMDINRENVDKLSNFYVINECADKYTNVDTDLIESELDQAHELSQNIAVTFWVMWAFFFMELITLCCMPCIKKWDEDGKIFRNTDDDYHVAENEYKVTDPEAEFMDKTTFKQ